MGRKATCPRCDLDAPNVCLCRTACGHADCAGRKATVDVEWLPPASGVIEPTDVRVQIPHDPAWCVWQQKCGGHA